MENNNTPEQARAEFLERRRAVIGGSDVAAILGLSRFKTAVDVYRSKVEGIDEPAGQAAYWGSLMEEMVAKEFAKRTGFKVQRVNALIRAAGAGAWRGADIDRAIVNPKISGNVRIIPEDKREGRNIITTDAILECKTANQYAAGEWGDSQEDEILAGKVISEHKIPLFYETQVQWYLGVTGVQTCYVAVLIGGNDFRIYKVDRDDDVIAALVESCGKFWHECVQAKTPPSPACMSDVQKLYPQDNGCSAEASNSQAADIGELRTLAGKVDGLKAQIEVVKTRLADSMGGMQILTLDGKKAVTYKTQKSRRFDSAAMKKAHPDLYQAYQNISETRVFKVL